MVVRYHARESCATAAPTCYKNWFWTQVDLKNGHYFKVPFETTIVWYPTSVGLSCLTDHVC